jgi:hypothetical protein
LLKGFEPETALPLDSAGDGKALHFSRVRDEKANRAGKSFGVSRFRQYSCAAMFDQLRDTSRSVSDYGRSGGKCLHDDAGRRFSRT